MGATIDFRRNIAALDDRVFISIFRECTPKFLVVTDNLSFSPASGFGLTQFVDTLRNTTIHGMTPIVKTASRYAAAGSDFTSFDFNDPTNGLLKSRYDAVFLFGFDSENSGNLPQPQIDAIARFMQAGGGVFATGDHQTLGAALSGNVPRVRNMRKWKNVDAPPHVSNTDRHSTNLSGADETEEFDDQSDAIPQRLYVNYRTQAGGTATIDRLAHPLLQMVGRRRVLEVFPDHPHEGECRVPASLATTFVLDGLTQSEWPTDPSGAAVSPEICAFTVSSGDGFPTGPTGAKLGLTPKLFAAIAAYDGQRANVGRVVTDATWHHFVNVNLDGTSTALQGLRPGGVDSDAMTRMRQYYVNIATWLMPRNVRRCLRFPLFIKELQRFPLFEELDLPRPPELIGTTALEVGRSVIAAIGKRLPAYVAAEIAEDALEDAFGPEQAARLREDSGDLGIGLTLPELAQAALGGQITAISAEIEALAAPTDIKPHETFEKAAAEGARTGVMRLLEQRRVEISRLDRMMEQLKSQVTRG